MDKQIRDFSRRLAASPSLSRRGLVGSFGRMSVAASAFGLGLTGLSKPVAEAAASGTTDTWFRAAGVEFRAVPSPTKPIYQVPPGTAAPAALGGVQPNYATNKNGCQCPGDVSNPCPNYNGSPCCYTDIYLTPGYGYQWGDCSQLPCCCNPCPDTCCPFGIYATWEFEVKTYVCCNGATYTKQAVPTYNFSCGFNGCNKGSCC